MEQIDSEHRELFALKYCKIAEIDFVYTLASAALVSLSFGLNLLIWYFRPVLPGTQVSDIRTNMFLLFCCFTCQSTVKVMSGRSVNLNTLFQGKHRPPKQLTSTKCT